MTLSEQVSAAREQILAATVPGQWYQARALKILARGDLPSGAMSLAMSELVADGNFQAWGTRGRLVRCHSHPRLAALPRVHTLRVTEIVRKLGRHWRLNDMVAVGQELACLELALGLYEEAGEQEEGSGFHE